MGVIRKLFGGASREETKPLTPGDGSYLPDFEHPADHARAKLAEIESRRPFQVREPYVGPHGIRC